MNSDRILVADLLRVIAIFMVIFSHILFSIGRPWLQLYQVSFGVYPFMWKTWGELGVTIFLIISGFSLEYTYGGKQIIFSRFYLKRITRIYPIYYMSLLLGLMVQVVASYWDHLYHSQPFILLPDFGYLDFLMALSGFNAFWGKWGGPLVWSSWFIGVIMVIYLLYPVISWGCRKSPWICIALLFLTSVISRVLIGESRMFLRNPMEWFPLNRVFEFGLGVFLAQLIEHGFLRRFNHVLQRLPFLTSLSAISFPLFLIHDPLRRFIVFGPKNTISLTTGIFIFLLLSIILSKVALAMDERIKDKLKGTYLLSWGVPREV